MDIVQLEYFQTVAKLQNLTRAGEVLHVSQPALSRAINRLEEDLGVQLFEREGNRIRLGATGVAFLSHVNQILAELNEAREQLYDMNDMDYGTVTLSSFTSGLLNHPISAFLAEHPNINLRHRIHSPEQMRQFLERGETDIVVSIQPIISPNIIWTPVMDDEMIALVPQWHPLAEKLELDLKDLAEERLCLNCYEYGIHEIFEGFCAQAGFEPHIVYEGSDGELCMSLLRSQNCIFLIPASIHIWKVLADREGGSDRESPPMKACHIRHPFCRWQYGVAISKVHALTGASKGFYRCLLDYFTEFQAQWTSENIRQFLLMESK